ncbi:hypothetical protein ABT039_22515 [Streptomyces lasiicapitis]|uniref:hypothetical protein n=1 Tax=Streptomyces lasiicapitis TaxID=1923961 RepID=UPI00332A6510
MTQACRITDHLVPLLMAVGGLIGGRLAFALAAQHGASLYWQAGSALLAYTGTVALLGRLGAGDPYEAASDATRALAHVVRAALVGALAVLCGAVQLLALLVGGFTALASPATT